MTTTDRTAHDVIVDELGIAYGYRHLPDLNATAVLDALTAAGYAVVRLPEPDFTDEDGVAWDGYLYITVGSDGIARLDGARTPTAELRETAANLLAAADHQEKNQ